MSTYYKILYLAGLLALGVGLFIIVKFPDNYGIGAMSFIFGLLAIIDAKIWLNDFKKEKAKEK